MNVRAIKMSQLATRPGQAGLLPLSHATIWRLVSAGEFPRPFKIGSSTMWDLAEVEAFIATKRFNNSDFKIG